MVDSALDDALLLLLDDAHHATETIAAAGDSATGSWGD